MDIRLLYNIRQFEISNAIQFIPEGSFILEIGAGAGWQAKYLAERGLFVEAIDIKGSTYENKRSWPVTEYDGKRIPFPDEHFDIVFSSNVLEHIVEVEIFQKEIRRVLKNHGIAIHVLPTGTWSVWTRIIYYFHLAANTYRRIFLADYRKLYTNSNNQNHNSIINKSQKLMRPHYFIRILRNLIPPKHGELGNTISEIYLFSQRRWIKLFKRTGWIVVESCPNKLFYTGFLFCNKLLTIEMRNKLSNILGSSCIIYVLRKSLNHFNDC